MSSKTACARAAKTLGYTISWGPGVGFGDIVDGCSLRHDNMLFFNNPGTCDLIRGPKTPGGFFRGCECSDVNNCVCLFRGVLCKPREEELLEGLDELLGELQRLEAGAVRSSGKGRVKPKVQVKVIKP